MSELIAKNRNNEDYSLMLRNFVLQKGDKGAKLFSTLRQYIKNCAYKKYPINVEDQEEIVQETAIKILNHYKSIKENHYAWLLKVAHNEYNNKLRKIVNNRNIVEVISKNEVITINEGNAELARIGENIASDIDCFEHVFKKATDTASGDSDREIYTQYVTGFSNEEIANSLGRSKSAIAKKLTILRERIRKLVIECC